MVSVSSEAEADAETRTSSVPSTTTSTVVPEANVTVWASATPCTFAVTVKVPSSALYFMDAMPKA